MKTLTIKEPWASLIINGYKKYEFRTWKTNYRGKLLIHTSISYDKNLLKKFEKLNIEYKPGYIIGEVSLVDIIPITKEFNESLIKENELVYGNSPIREGYAWKIENIKVYDKPIKAKGKLGLWEYKM